MTVETEPLIIPDFTMAGLADLGKLTVTLAALPDIPDCVAVLTALSRKDNTSAQRTRTKVREQDMLEERMLAATREIERMNRQLEQFASVAAHDLQAPVRQLFTLITFLKQDLGTGLSAQGSILFADIEEVLNRMRSQIDGLYEYSRTSSQPLVKADSNLGDAVADALANLTVQIRETNAEIVVTGLPVYRYSKALMISVFQNLIGNAIKYRSEAAPQIEIAATDQFDRIRITVSDNGSGIDPDHSETVFKLFSRGYPRVEAGGIGIGLALCRQIIARHGGTIRHDPAYSGGTRMVIELPKARGRP